MTLDNLELENNVFFSFRRQYLANSTHHCRALKFASGRLSCFVRYKYGYKLTAKLGKMILTVYSKTTVQN